MPNVLTTMPATPSAAPAWSDGPLRARHCPVTIELEGAHVVGATVSRADLRNHSVTGVDAASHQRDLGPACGEDARKCRPRPLEAASDDGGAPVVAGRDRSCGLVAIASPCCPMFARRRAVHALWGCPRSG